ncbi:hypothetical protein ACFV2N_22570 [Streptomyces sp. NPDC059680]|uniref:hypothetical protein n=1 Tax=Streptomyces sp. NPDC059680 TaxID=3346904 RepID=UPI0036A2D433
MSEERQLSRLDALRFARRVVQQQASRELALIDQWIADEEQCEAEKRQGQKRRPPTPGRLVHTGG